MPTLSRRQWLAVALGVAPWTWYLVRDLDPRLDVIALAWPMLGFGGAAALAVGSIVLRSWEEGTASLSWLLATVVVVILPWTPTSSGSPEDGLRVVAANAFGGQTIPERIADAVSGQHPDLVVVSEASPELDRVLAGRFPHRAFVRDVGVYSSMPLRLLGKAPARQRGLRVEVDGRFVVYALHLQKPGPTPSSVEVGFRTHRRIVNTIADAIAEEHQPVVVAGDLNLIDRAGGYRRFTGGLDDAMRSGWTGPTSWRNQTKPLLARVDHIFMPEAWCSTGSKVFELHGSDHRGVATTIGPCK